jgi:hypothetical protein
VGVCNRVGGNEADEEGVRMLNVVGLGIYVSSFAKDLVCTPRPYSPPVVRLSESAGQWLIPIQADTR